MNLVGNKNNLNLINDIIAGDKLSHAYLFVGPKFIGKTLFATYFGKKLLCSEENGPCGKCLNCRLFDSGNHPDFLVNDSERAVSIDEIRELIHFLEMKPYQSQVKIALISHYERLSNQAANSFLKTLEEPVKNTILILTAENIQNLLPTVVSRSQIIKFNSVPKAEIADYICKELGMTDKAETELAVRLSGGRIGLAIELVKNKERLSETKVFIEKFEQIINSDILTDKLLFAEGLANEKEGLQERLDYMEIFLETLLSEPISLKYCQILDKIAKSKDYLGRNANPRLVMEYLMLTGA